MACSPTRSVGIFVKQFRLSPSIKGRGALIHPFPTESAFHSSSFKHVALSPRIEHKLDKQAAPKTGCAVYLKGLKYDYKKNTFQQTGASSEFFSSKSDISFNTPDRPKLSEQINKLNNKYYLGNGGFGFVVKGNYKGDQVAVKVVPKHKILSLRNEKNSLDLNHSNIIRMYKVIIESGWGLVVMERNVGLDIHELLLQISTSLKTSDRLRYLINIANALKYCHCKGVLHLDVKPKNILLSVSNDTCKLCDFGCSLRIDQLEHCPIPVNTGINTVSYTDPQLFLGKLPSTKSDVYSFGITIWQLMSQEIPYKGCECHTIVYKVVSENFRPRYVSPATYSERRIIDLYEACWEADPSMRPNMNKIVEELEIILARCVTEGNIL